MPAQKKDKEKRKERSKDSPYFPKGMHSKESHDTKEYQKNI
jgi:hypothetical protein